MKKSRGFTLIELLIVVAIIAILAAIAIPNFLEAQVRAKVSRVRADLRSIGTAIEAYCVDTNMYPAAMGGTATKSINANIPNKKATKNAKERCTFASLSMKSDPNDHFLILTTPVTYMSAIPTDPFADTQGCNFGYTNAVNIGWIMWSYGPDTDETRKSQIDGELEASWNMDPNDMKAWTADVWAVCSVYNPFKTNPMPSLLAFSASKAKNPDNATALTYDPSNGSVSDGDLWRFAGE